MARKKIKKFLKKAAPLLAVAGLGKAFMNARNRNAMINSADANDGFRTAFTKPNMLDIAGGILDRGRGVIKARPKMMMTAQDMANDPMFINAETLMNDQRMFKKGGRVGCGVAKKGFGKAMKRRKK